MPLNGDSLAFLGAGLELHNRAEVHVAVHIREHRIRKMPIYETMPGWKESTYGARRWADLPATAIKYIVRIEELIGTQVALLSTSPQRDDTIRVRDPFED